MIGRVGLDDFGTRLRTDLASAGVDVSAVSVDPDVGSGMSAAIVRDDGEYGAVIVSGSNLRIDPESVETQWRKLHGASVLVLQNEVPEPVNVAGARAARTDGALVILNAAPARPMSADLLDCVDLFIVNRIEAEMLSGMPVRDHAAAFAAVRSLSKPRRAVIITLGADGLIVQAGEGEAPVLLAARVVSVSSTHGAGDCFIGSLATRLARGAPLIDAAEFANQTAAWYVSGEGAKAARPG